MSEVFSIIVMWLKLLPCGNSSVKLSLWSWASNELVREPNLAPETRVEHEFLGIPGSECVSPPSGQPSSGWRVFVQDLLLTVAWWLLLGKVRLSLKPLSAGALLLAFSLSTQRMAFTTVALLSGLLYKQKKDKNWMSFAILKVARWIN